MGNEKGLIFDIQGFSVHDGPGCRTLVFLKGCPLKCRWCSNPEGIEPHIQLMYYRDRCIMNYACRDVCKSHAIQVQHTEAPITINRKLCNQCTDFACINACNYNALKLSGYYMTVDELMDKIQKDRQYWGPRGGVTLSGGEPMFQPDFTRAVLQQCYNSYIHTAMETSGYAAWIHYKKLLNYLDWIFFDLKHMDERMHEMGTGLSNKCILDNACKIASQKEYKLVFRMPVIPGFNDSLENINATAEFLNSIDRKEINILPLHHLGSSKYDLLNLKYYYKEHLATPSSIQMEKIKDIFSKYSIKCYIGSNTPF